jgi:hypothetical protein
MLRRIPLLLAIALTCFAYGCTPRTLGVDLVACSAHPIYDELLANDGTLRVIVTLSGEPADGVADLQDRLLGELEGTDVEVVRRYESFPILALRVSEAAFCRLVASPLVETIEVDEADPPTDG